MSKIKTRMRYLSSSVGEDRKITDLKTKVEKRDMQPRGLSRGWASLADDVLGFAGRIDKSAWYCYGLTQADNLGYLSMMSTDAIKTIGIHTYDDESDCTEYPGYYPSGCEDNNSVYCSSELELW